MHMIDASLLFDESLGIVTGPENDFARVGTGEYLSGCCIVQHQDGNIIVDMFEASALIIGIIVGLNAPVQWRFVDERRGRLQRFHGRWKARTQTKRSDAIDVFNGKRRHAVDTRPRKVEKGSLLTGQRRSRVRHVDRREK